MTWNPFKCTQTLSEEEARKRHREPWVDLNAPLDMEDEDPEAAERIQILKKAKYSKVPN